MLFLRSRQGGIRVRGKRSAPCKHFGHLAVLLPQPIQRTSGHDQGKTMIIEIDKLRAEAKRLKKAFAAGDTEARTRLRKFVPGSADPKHADFLHVIALENGHESWPKLKFALETARMTRDQRAERLKTALYHGQQWVVRRLLLLDPALPEHNLGLQIAMYDTGAIRSALKTDPAAATKTIGVRTPILHLAFSKYIHMVPEKQADMLSLAQLLVASGADIDDGFAPEPGSDHKVSALYGALGHANNMALAGWLLDHGANPDDNESLYHATELGHHDGLKLLIRHGVSTRGTNALTRALDFNDLEAVRLLLEHGADPNEAVTGHPSGQPIDTIPALHQAARRWCSGDIVRLLLEHGADPNAVWHGHSPYATARIYGNDTVAETLNHLGHSTHLSPLESALATCAQGKAPSEPLEPGDLNDEDQSLLTRIVLEPTRLEHVKALIEAGFDPDRTDSMGMTPLHLAGWAGLPRQVAFLLTCSPDLDYRNGFGGDALGTVVHGAEHRLDSADRDHIGCARLLLEAGAKLRQEEIDATGSEEMARFLENWKTGHTPD